VGSSWNEPACRAAPVWLTEVNDRIYLIDVNQPVDAGREARIT
jgi:hypothetical protein